ncbi:MAG: acetate--CoA ligase family protein [Pseudomonadota bacterium]
MAQSSDKSAALLTLLQPKTVAVIGGDSAAEVIRQCRMIGFDGELHAVNPNRQDIEGVPCVASIDDLPLVPDASFVAAPPKPTLDILRALNKRGAPGAVCFAAGFAETGASGAELQQELRAAAGDMAVMGPNCHGYVNYLDGIALWPDDHGSQRCERGVALISQSGNIAINLTMQQRGLDIAYVISIGNNSALGTHDYINALLDDPRVTAIGLHIEGLADINAFSEAAIRALHKRVPIVALKAGRSEQGARITMSHTGSLAGSDRLYSALFDRVGIARCDTVSQFLETLKFVSIVGAVPGATMASMSCSGGDASIVADNAERLGVETPPFSDASTEKLKALLGPNVSVANPIDYHLYIWGKRDKLTECFTGVLENNFACTLLVLDYPADNNRLDEACQAAEAALLDSVQATGSRAVIVASLPETMPGRVRERLKAAGIAPMQGIEDCVFAFRAAATISAAQRRADSIRPVLPRGNAVGDVRMLDEWQSKERLREAGVAIPEAKLCAPSAAVAAAQAIGGRVVLKAVSAELAHKTEVGGVVVGVEGDDAVEAAANKLAGLSDKLLVESMVTDPVAEVIVGVSRDPTFGLSLLIGAGGTLVELVDDTATLLLSASREDIQQAVDGLRVSKLIKSWRGGVAGDLEALIDAITCIAEYAEANADSLHELDVNPLLVTADGAVAVDALIRTTQS